MPCLSYSLLFSQFAVLAGPDGGVAEVLKYTEGRGVEIVMDFVAEHCTPEKALKMLRQKGGMVVWAAASISGTHFNPGVTLAMALRRKFPWVQVIPYIFFQILGGLLAATVLTVLYNGIITSKLVALGIGVLLLVVIEGPISMVSLNTARDLGPRIFL
jgi:hypothetical protein